MSCLFVLGNGYCKPNEETLLISPFKEIWENDKLRIKKLLLSIFLLLNYMQVNL